MQENNLQNNNSEKNITHSFSMRKIPIVSNSHSIDENAKDDNIDKIKIIELSNIIDKWEQEILFSDNGFFSLKGKDIENKSKEFISELENLINSKISQMSFTDNYSKEIAQKIKQDKISSIKREMLSYEQNQIAEWELDVYENAINSSISRAVLYKSNPNIAAASLKNGLTVIKVMSEQEKWSTKTYIQKINSFKSQFYYSLINAFISDRDIKAYIYFYKYKDLIISDNKENLEKAVKHLKTNVIAYNWAKELFSYKLSKNEQAVEINKIKDDELKSEIRKLLLDFSKSEEKETEDKKAEKNKKNWEEIDNILKEDIDKAFLYIDYSMTNDNIKHKKEYIRQIKQNGFIDTDKKEFINLIKEFFDNFEQFKTKDITDFKYCLSEEDYSLFLEFQKITHEKFSQMKSDYKYVQMQKFGIKNTQDKYDFVKLLIYTFKEYKLINKKEADLETRNKLIDFVSKRFANNEKEGDKNDRIIDNSGK